MPNVKVNPVTKLCRPDPLTIPNENATITFIIDPAAGNDWSWNPTDPLIIDAPDGIFTIAAPNPQKLILVQDRNRRPEPGVPGDQGTFKYTAILIKAGTTTPVIIDPAIQNQ